MSETNIHFLGEKDYLPAMDTENRVWRERHVFNGRFTTRDGLRLNYYFAPHPEPKAVIIMLHGYFSYGTIGGIPLNSPLYSMFIKSVSKM